MPRQSRQSGICYCSFDGSIGTGARSLWWRFFCCRVGAGSLYLRLGSPGLASEPLTAQRSMQARCSRRRSKIWSPRSSCTSRTTPKMAAAGRFWHRSTCSSAATQIRRAPGEIRLLLLGESADREANLGEALVAEANGVVTAEAKSRFRARSNARQDNRQRPLLSRHGRRAGWQARGGG